MANQEPSLGIWTDYVTGESGWTNQFNFNMSKLATMCQLTVINRTLTAAPGTPANGDTYIVAAAPTGTWANQAGKIAVWRATLSQWEFYAPRNGLQAVILAESKMTTYLSGAWTPGITL